MGEWVMLYKVFFYSSWVEEPVHLPCEMCDFNVDVCLSFFLYTGLLWKRDFNLSETLCLNKYFNNNNNNCIDK